MHREPAQAETVRLSGATPVHGDLIADSVDDLAEKFAGHDAIVFSAGAHGTGMDETTSPTWLAPIWTGSSCAPGSCSMIPEPAA
ncbi:NAD(P)H-binding protein [Saccharopolyspora sp. NPDC003752]